MHKPQVVRLNSIPQKNVNIVIVITWGRRLKKHEHSNLQRLYSAKRYFDLGMIIYGDMVIMLIYYIAFFNCTITSYFLIVFFRFCHITNGIYFHFCSGFYLIL